MKRFALILPALLVCAGAFAAAPVTYDVKVVEDGHLVYGFTASAPMGKGVHFESSQKDSVGDEQALDYINDKLELDLAGNQVDEKGILKSRLVLSDVEKYIGVSAAKDKPMVDIPAVVRSHLDTPLSLPNGEPVGVSYTLGSVSSEDGSKLSITEPRTLVITATWAH